MPMSVTYTTFNGQIVSENRGGVIRNYVSDAEGNTIALTDETGAVTDSWSYWPYGEVRNHTGPSTTPFTYRGTHGYFADEPTHYYVRARSFRAELTRWMTVDPIWPWVSAYRYALCRPNQFTDASGLFPTLGCSAMSKCLAGAPSCGGKKLASISMMLCVFWQETSFGHQTPRGGIGSCTESCFSTLHGNGCFTQFSSYDDFAKRATPCEKAQAAYSFIQIVGLSHYGPGPGLLGDYRGPTGAKIRACEKCIDHDVPTQCRHYFGGPVPPLDEICGYCFQTAVHR